MTQRGRGALILLSSAVGAFAVPYSANYAATKAYVSALGRALYYELKPAGVDVLTLAPGPTETEGLITVEGIDFGRLPMPRRAMTAMFGQMMAKALLPAPAAAAPAPIAEERAS
jgi:uncharacterized protein